MRRRGLSVVLLVSFVLIAGVSCGSAATRKPLALSARVIRRGEFTGYVPGTRESVKTPEGYLVDTNMTLPQRKAWAWTL